MGRGPRPRSGRGLSASEYFVEGSGRGGDRAWVRDHSGVSGPRWLAQEHGPGGEQVVDGFGKFSETLDQKLRVSFAQNDDGSFGTFAHGRLSCSGPPGCWGSRLSGSWFLGFVDFKEELRIEALHLPRQTLDEQLVGALE